MDGKRFNIQDLLRPMVMFKAPELLLRQEEEEEDAEPSPPVMRSTQTDVYSLGIVCECDAAAIMRFYSHLSYRLCW